MAKNESLGVEAAAWRKLNLSLWFIFPLFIMLGKLPGSPASTFLSATFSLVHLPSRIRPHLEYIVFIPLSLVIVVFFRLMLGVHLFGVFRPIFIAIAFRIVGIHVGLPFLLVVMVGITTLRPLLRLGNLHYFARVSVILSSVVILMLATLVFSSWWHVDSLLGVAHFPIISLCLISDSFAKSLYEDGLTVAGWRAAMTILVAMLITGISRIPGGMRLLLYYPELLIAQVGCILMIAQFLDLRLLEGRKVSGSKRTVRSEFKASALTVPENV